MKLGVSDMTRISCFMTRISCFMTGSKSEDDDWMNDTQSGGVSGRGCRVSPGGRSASSSGRHLHAPSSPPPISLLGRREVVPGWSRAYQLARQECLHRVTTNQQPPPLLPSITDTQRALQLLRRVAQIGKEVVLAVKVVCVQTAWKVQPVEDCWQATGAEDHHQSLQQICFDRSKYCSS